MRTRKMIDGNLVFFGVKGVEQTIAPHATCGDDTICGDDRICGAGYDDGNTIQVNGPVYSRYPTSIFVEGKQSYADGIDGVNQGLMQRLALIQGELTHYLNAGFPLIDKKSNKAVYDAYVINVVSRHPDVTGITKIESKVENNAYKCKLTIFTTYGKSSINFTESI